MWWWISAILAGIIAFIMAAVSVKVKFKEKHNNWFLTCTRFASIFLFFVAVIGLALAIYSTPSDDNSQKSTDSTSILASDTRSDSIFEELFKSANLDITHPADYITFNSYSNNYGLDNEHGWGDEHDFLRVGPTNIASTDDLKNVVVAQEGKEYYVYMYVHNNAASWLNLVANNVRAQIVGVDNAPGTTQQLRGFIDADNCGANGRGNAGSPCTFWDEAGFQSADGRNFHMEYINDSAIYKNYSGTFKLPDAVATASGNNGTLVGDTIMDGRIPGCAEHAGFVIIRVVPVY